jgi:hypothetical protein
MNDDELDFLINKLRNEFQKNKKIRKYRHDKMLNSKDRQSFINSKQKKFRPTHLLSTKDEVGVDKEDGKFSDTENIDGFRI